MTHPGAPVRDMRCYLTQGGGRVSLRAFRFAPVSRPDRSERTEAWCVVNGYAYAPAPVPTLPRPSAVIDPWAPTAMHPAEHPVRQALATIAILVTIVVLCACWSAQ